MFQLKITSNHPKAKSERSYVDHSISAMPKTTVVRYAKDLLSRNDWLVKIELQPLGMDCTLQEFTN